MLIIMKQISDKLVEEESLQFSEIVPFSHNPVDGGRDAGSKYAETRLRTSRH